MEKLLNAIVLVDVKAIVCSPFMEPWLKQLELGEER